MSPDLELFVFPPSPRAFKVMAVANHLGLEPVIRFVDLPGGAQRAPEFVALNPNMRMPALRHGDYTLWESNAILQYLAGLRPESGLLPQNERGRLDVTRWQFWDLAHWDSACAVYLFENIVKPGLLKLGAPDAAAIEKAKPNFDRAAQVLNDQLKGRRYVTGGKLTLADFALGAPLNYVAEARIPVDPYPEIKRWFADLSSLPAWRTTREASALSRAA